ncbi:MAG TPA: hypothetical protein VGV35_18325 [Bryobacteraceae bacterium]|nr:hypothetical protein [Bryobacteraceae bacterium]
MRIDKTHKPWMVATIILLLLSAVIYVLYATRAPGGPTGGSAWGLTFGIAGYALMLYAGLLGARKKKPIWRIGKTKTWMRGHLWLGLLSLPLILFHSGFAFRGPLTAVLMWLFFFVIGSGILGAIIQHYVPALMTSRVPMETIYEEIPHVRVQLRAEADQLVASVCGPLDDSASAVPANVGQQPAAVTAIVDIEADDRAHFRDVYLSKIQPFLDDPEAPGAELADPRRGSEVFDALRRLLAKPAHAVLDDLQNICDEERQLNRQIRIYQWLHGWLLVHVPLSIALLVLGGVHAIMALRY